MSTQENNGFKINVHVCNNFIDMFVKYGCLEIAKRGFNKMEGRTVVSWLSMITELTMHRQANKALRLSSEMIKLVMKPNGVTFTRLLHA